MGSWISSEPALKGQGRHRPDRFHPGLGCPPCRLTSGFCLRLAYLVPSRRGHHVDFPAVCIHLIDHQRAMGFAAAGKWPARNFSLARNRAFTRSNASFGIYVALPFHPQPGYCLRASTKAMMFSGFARGINIRRAATRMLHRRPDGYAPVAECFQDPVRPTGCSRRNR